MDSVGAFQVEMHSVGAFQVDMYSVGAFYEIVFKYSKLPCKSYDIELSQIILSWHAWPWR